MTTTALVATGVVRTNSLDFLDHVFALYAARVPFVMLSDAGQARQLPGIRVDRCITPKERTGWFIDHHPIETGDAIAQITYTSGTEGRAKGIVLTHDNLADATRRLIDAMQITPDICEYVGVPATYSFGLARYRAISAVGGKAYMPPRGFDPLEFARMLAAGQINALSVVPSLLRLILASPEITPELGQRLRWMEIGSQPMSREEKLAVRAMFPKARIVQHYGLTEASRTSFLQISDVAEARLGSVGRPMEGTEIGFDDLGRIRIRGPHVARARIEADGLHSLLDADGWLQTNDLGHMRDGDLYFDGRADDLINCAGVKIMPDHLEAALHGRLAPDLALSVARIPDPERGDGVLIAYEGDPQKADDIRRVADRALREMGVSAGSSLKVMPVDRIPRTETGKVQRKCVTEQYLASVPAAAPTRGAPGDVTDVRSLFEHEFPGRTIRDDDTFESLGGDSLHYINFSIAFERRFGALPDKWEKLTAAQLHKHASATPKSGWLPLETVTLTRSFFIICILGLHSQAFVYSSNWGAAYFLVLLAGYSVARFQLPEVIRTGSVRTLLGTAISVAIPTIMVIAILDVLTRHFNLMQLLLISNFLDPYSIHTFLFYFVEFYVQLFVLTAMLFAIPSVRSVFAKQPLYSSIIVLFVMIGFDHALDHIWNTNYNFHRTPWHYAWPFLVGIVIANANDFPSRLLALTVSLIAILIQWGFTSAAAYVASGCVLILFVRAIRLPAPAKLVIAQIGSASMFIFLCHEPTIRFVTTIFGEPHPWISLVMSMVVGITGMQVYNYLERRFFMSRSGKEA